MNAISRAYVLRTTANSRHIVGGNAPMAASNTDPFGAAIAGAQAKAQQINLATGFGFGAGLLAHFMWGVSWPLSLGLAVAGGVCVYYAQPSLQSLF